MNNTELSLALLSRSERKIRIEGESVFPDYCSDIVRVIRVDTLPCITSKKVYFKDGGVSLELSGRVDMNVVYSSAEGTLEAYGFSVDFADGARLPLSQDTDTESVAVIVTPSVDGVSCKAQSQRKVSVRCELILDTTLKGNRAFEVFLGDELLKDGKIEKKSFSVTTARISFLLSDEFDFSEEIKLPAGLPPMERILSCRGKMSLENISPSDNRVSFSSLLSLSCLYLPESEGESVRAESFFQPIELSAVVEADASPDSAVSGYLSPVLLNYEITTDSFGENRILKVSGSYKGDFLIMENSSLTLAEDAYAVGGDAEVKEGVERFSRFFGTLREETAVREKIPLKSTALRLEDTSAEIKLKGWGFENGRLFADYKVRVSAIGVLENGEVPVDETMELHLYFSLPSELERAKESITPELTATVGYIDTRVQNGDAELSFDVITRADIFLEEERSFVSSVTVTERESERKDIFYYPSSSDTLWSVAKHYGVKISELEKKNGISDGNLKRVMKI